MAVVPMVKVRCVAHSSVREPLLESLYGIGVLEAVRTAPLKDELQSAVSVEALDEVHRRIETVENTMRVLRSAVPQRRSPLEYFVAVPKPKDRKSFERTLETFDARGFCSRVLELEKTSRSLAERRQSLVDELAKVEPLEAFSVPLSELKDTKWTVVRLVRGPGTLDETLLTEDAVVFARKGRGPEEMVLLACARESWQTLEASLASSGWIVVDTSQLEKTPQEEARRLREASEGLRLEMERNEQDLSDAAEQLTDLLVVHDWLINERERLEQMARFIATDSTVLLEGWARAESTPAIESAVRPFSHLAVLSLSPPETGEEVPIILDNPSWLKPFEFVTSLYGLPRYGQVDPTPWLAPFFLLFFSLCLTDAAYGIVLALAAASLIWREGLVGSPRRLAKLLFYGGLATIISGALAGGWFGDILFYLPGPLRALGSLTQKIVILDPLENLLLFMGATFGLGFIQVCVGILIKMVHKMRKGRFLSGLIDEAVWVIFLNGLLAWGVVGFTGRGLGVLPALKAVVVAAGVVRVLTYGRERHHWPARLGVGLVSLYQAVGVLSDVLSYARVVALGLATGVIALVVDTLCVMTAGLPWVGLLLAVLIFVVGHSFNIIINVIGAFVHTGRLQFVEFFSKFFVPGGPRWRPFQFQSRYFVLEG